MRLFLLITIWSCLALSRPIELSASNSVVFTGEVNAKTVHTTSLALLAVRALLPLDQPVYLILDSPGGYLDQGIRFLNVLQTQPNVHLVCVECSSMAGIFFQQSPGKRYATLKSSFMAHHSVPARLPYADAMVYGPMGMNKADYLEKIEGKDWVLVGQELIDFKAADELVEIKCDEHIRNTELFDCEK